MAHKSDITYMSLAAFLIKYLACKNATQRFKNILKTSNINLRRAQRQSIVQARMPKTLAVFDFDHTILDDNSDTAVVALVDKSSIPQDIKNLHTHDGWTAFMQGIFTLLHGRGISAESIQTTVANLPPVMGIPELIRDLNVKEADVIIVSDSNSIFIDVWLEKHELKKCVSRVFTNPCTIEGGLLKISMFHLQDYCKLSTKNLCKGQILDDFVNEQKQRNTTYDRIVYIGDGVNDFCPILRLREGDLACVRNNFKLLDLVTKAKKGKSFDQTGKPHILRPEVLIWETGNDILRKLRE